MKKELLKKLNKQLKDEKAKGIIAIKMGKRQLALDCYGLCMKIELAIDSLKENN
mgnify:CR=1 FL=1